MGMPSQELIRGSVLAHPELVAATGGVGKALLVLLFPHPKNPPPPTPHPPELVLAEAGGVALAEEVNTVGRD